MNIIKLQRHPPRREKAVIHSTKTLPVPSNIFRRSVETNSSRQATGYKFLKDNNIYMTPAICEFDGLMLSLLNLLTRDTFNL